MPNTRLFAYNTGSLISGTSQVGDIAISVSPLLNYSQGAGGVRWWNGPDEDLGYVIAHTTPSGTQPNPDNVPAYIGFWRTTSKTENSLISLTNSLFGTSYTTGGQCKTYLNDNGYWTSYDVNAQGFSYSNFESTVGLTAVGNVLPSVSSGIYFLTTAANGVVGNVYRTTAIQYNRNFSATWSTFIGGGTSADGYCIQWTPTNNTYGSVGGGVGLLSTAINAITFLTHTNNNYTWYKNNVSQGATSVTSGFWRQTLYFWGDYNHSAQTFDLYWNTTNTKPVSPNQTFNGFLFDTGSYYMGFGAATGGANDNHQLINWSLTFT